VGEFVVIGVGPGGGPGGPGGGPGNGMVELAGELGSIPTVGPGVRVGVLVLGNLSMVGLGWVETEGCKETRNSVGLVVGGSEVT